MALLTVNFMSSALVRTVPMNVILPVDKMTGPTSAPVIQKPFKTLYLLHGVFGSYIDWVSGTRIQRWAEENDLCVIMPSGDNAYYTDNPASCNAYGRFVGEELVEITRRMFHLSSRREDTFIGGLSMGGYGALASALRYPDTFGAAVCLSPALLFEKDFHLERMTDDGLPSRNPTHYRTIFGDMSDPASNPNNPRILMENVLRAGKPVPKLYFACGTEDVLCHPVTLSFCRWLDEKKVDYTLEEGPGSHEWDFWDRYIHKVMSWLPLERGGAGINSGNVPHH